MARITLQVGAGARAVGGHAGAEALGAVGGAAPRGAHLARAASPPQAPQWSRSVAVSTQISAPTVPPSLAPAEQATWPVGHESRQTPLSHCRPPVQAFPHAPQLALSAFTATQRSPQSICDPVQVGRVSVGASKPASEREASWPLPTTGVPSHAATKSVAAIASHDKQDRPVGTLIIWNLPTVNRLSPGGEDHRRGSASLVQVGEAPSGENRSNRRPAPSRRRRCPLARSG